MTISIHALLAESDSPASDTPAPSRNFYPRSPCGERPLHLVVFGSDCNFYPRSPCGERQTEKRKRKTSHYFYPRSPCGERPIGKRQIIPIKQISIHALLAESDLREGPHCQGLSEFLSTLSLRRATFYPPTEPFKIGISIHALLAESDWIHPARPTANTISIHALLAESDTIRL